MIRNSDLERMEISPEEQPKTVKFIKNALGAGNKHAKVMGLLGRVVKTQEEIYGRGSSEAFFTAVGKKNTVGNVQKWLDAAQALSKEQKKAVGKILVRPDEYSLDDMMKVAKEVGQLDGKPLGILKDATGEQDYYYRPGKQKEIINNVLKTCELFKKLKDHHYDLLENSLYAHGNRNEKVLLPFTRLIPGAEAISRLSKNQTDLLLKAKKDFRWVIHDEDKPKIADEAIDHIKRIAVETKGLKKYHFKHLRTWSSSQSNPFQIDLKKEADALRPLNEKQAKLWNDISYIAQREGEADAVHKRVLSDYDLLNGIKIPPNRFNDETSYAAERHFVKAIAKFGDGQFKLAAKSLKGAKIENYKPIVNKIEAVGETNIKGAEAALEAGVPMDSLLFVPAAKAITQGNIEKFSKDLYKYHKKTLPTKTVQELQRRFPAR